ncbi:GpE family phage tail protein [Hylemonella gracilis]|nr:GpE family phage tail protein [Hylemonella gracilis]
MADLATVWHWPLSEMLPMSLGDLAAWRERARVRTQAQKAS